MLKGRLCSCLPRVMSEAFKGTRRCDDDQSSINQLAFEPTANAVSLKGRFCMALFTCHTVSLEGGGRFDVVMAQQRSVSFLPLLVWNNRGCLLI
mmetsp:Transcript_11190/g.30899  ORF Transcript_11190/g.30899 Transcript_11190/m.30899 type:complete len:94 (-) Transcript_11190:140-421(-)